MKQITLLILTLSLSLYACKKSDNLESTRNKVIPENISLTVAGIPMNFITKECLEEDSRISSGINMATRADSFGISRSTSIRFSDSLNCMVQKLSIGLDIKDRNDNFPLNKSMLETHLLNIKNKNSEDANFIVTFTEDCNNYQSTQRVFDSQSQLYWHAKNEAFNYDINAFSVTDGSYCGYGINFNLIELEGSFSGTLFTANGSAPELSIDLVCQDFYIAILHEK